MTVVTNPCRADGAPASAIVPHLGSTPSPVNDLTIVAGLGGDTWRFPACRAALAAAGPAFAALSRQTGDIIIVDYVDKKAFERLLKHASGETFSLTSPAAARLTLDASHKFICAPIAELCVRYLDEVLDAPTAVDTLRDLRFLCVRMPDAPSAPPPTSPGDERTSAAAAVAHWCEALALNALLVVDEHADEVLTDERIEELGYEDIALIIRRDTLRVSSELVLAVALARWSLAACKRAKHELTSADKRAALGELAYQPRFLLLSETELQEALALELLDPVETQLVRARRRGALPPAACSSDQDAMLRRFERPRPSAPAALPIHLSTRSAPSTTKRKRGKCGKKNKKIGEEESLGDKDKDNCCSCFGDSLLRAFVCLFD